MTPPLTLVAALLLALLGGREAGSDDLDEARQFLADYDRRAAEYYNNVTLAAWAYNTNLTDHNQKIYAAASVAVSLFEKEAAKNCSKFNWRDFQDDYVRRQFEKISRLGTSALPKEQIEEVDQLENDMGKIYSTGKFCERGECYSLDPDLTRMFATERDWNKLRRAWQGWRNVTGRKMTKKFERFVALQNKAAELNGYPDAGAYWRSSYETDDFEDIIEGLWQTVKPLYQQLHAFVRKRLRQVYRDNKFPEEGHIPAHILGNMWAQTWGNIFEHVQPYPEASTINVTAALLNKGFNSTDIIKMSEEFFVSLGLEPMPDTFWERSMFERPSDGRSVVCHASAWDFYDAKDFRIKQCTDINEEWLLTSHHEMGHVAYFQQYKEQPVVFRDGANNGFHEAVGDVMALSVATPEHLNEVGLLETLDTNMEADLNFLMSQALEKVAFLPFGFLIDQWRWSVFRGDMTPNLYNLGWWRLRCQYQGVSPPVVRTNEDFDPGAKYHVPNNVPYIRYFISYILQFQFHKALCQVANNTNALHRCDIYRSKAAGEALGNMLKLGSSVPWPQALKQVTGTEQMDAQALMDYFQPLYEWLKKENEGEVVGWDENCPLGSLSISDTAVTGFASVYIVLLLTFVALVL